MKLSKAVLLWNKCQAKIYAEKAFPGHLFKDARETIEKAYRAGAAYGARNQALDEQFRSTGEEWPLPSK